MLSIVPGIRLMVFVIVPVATELLHTYASIKPAVMNLIVVRTSSLMLLIGTLVISGAEGLTGLLFGISSLSITK